LSGWLAAAILFSSLTMALSLAWAYAELLMLLFALAGLVALHYWWRADSRRPHAALWLVLAGVFAGLACGCKYPGILVPLGIGVTVLMVGIVGRPGTVQARLTLALSSGLMFATTAALTFAPWLVKNWLITGNPVYPLLWPSADVDTIRLWYYSRPDLAEPIWRAVIILVRATLFGVQSGNNIDATLGPLLLLGTGLLPLAWPGLARPLRQDLALLALFAATAYFGWVAFAVSSGIAQQARPYFSILPALALLGAGALAGFRQLDTPQLKLSMVVNAAFALAMCLGVLELSLGFIQRNPLPFIAGLQSAEDFEVAQLGWYAPMLAQLNQLPSGSDVLFLWEPRTLGCSPDIRCRPDPLTDRWWHAQRLGISAVQALEQWRAAGVTHVLIHEAGVRFVQAEVDNAYLPVDWDELTKLREQLRLVANFGDAYALYAIPQG
jgi:hypothetical protein